MLKESIVQLKKSIISAVTLVEKMINDSTAGLIENDQTKLLEVIEKDEPRANQYEIDIDEYCTNTIALYHPEAKDLRTILMILKMNNDIERIGDSAVNISESALYLINKPQVKPYIDLPKMAKESSGMLRDSINSFIYENTELANNVLRRDDIVDELQSQIRRELITLMFSDPEIIERSFHIIRITNNLERIADLSTNICEDVIFIVEGKVIKHSGKLTK